MIRRFSTSGMIQAMARSSRVSLRSGARPRAASATQTATPSAAHPTAVSPTAAVPASGVASTAASEASPKSLSANKDTTKPSPVALGPAPLSWPPTSTSSHNGFTPRLVPELHTKPTSTLVKDEVDEDEVVDNLASLEMEEGLGEDWTTSFQGLGQKPFDRQAIDILMAPVVPEDVEVTPDGLIYLPEIKYRRILNRAFGPGGWGIAPRTKTLVTKRQVTREYGLVCLGRLVSVSRGEMDFFSAEGVTTAMEGCKSNALMRCCKDLGIASELWDPAFIREFKLKKCDSKYFEKKRRFVWKRKDRPWEYPYNQ